MTCSMTPLGWRERLADRLAHGQLTSLRSTAEQATRAAELAREANRQTQGRLSLLLAADVSRERQVRAVQLCGALLHQLTTGRLGTTAAAQLGQAKLDHWCSVHDDLSRPLPDDGLLVADREPAQPAFVHPGTDSEPADG